jgi:hypothetical protein
MNVEVDARWNQRPLDSLSVKDERIPVAGKKETENPRYQFTEVFGTNSYRASPFIAWSPCGEHYGTEG